MNDGNDSGFHMVPFLDRLDRLIIGSAHFDRCYQAALVKYAKSKSLRSLSLDFSITNGSFLADPYADAELDSDGFLKVYWRSRRQTTRPGLSVTWAFGACPCAVWDVTGTCGLGFYHNQCYDESGPVPAPHHGHHVHIPVGQIFDHCDSPIFELRQSRTTPHQYVLYNSKTDRSHLFLQIEGGPSLKAWTAKISGMSRSSLVFNVYRRNNQEHRRINSMSLAATISPVIEGLAFKDIKTKNGLMRIKFTSRTESREVKAAVLGVALLLCLRHFMKKLYCVFETVAGMDE